MQVVVVDRLSQFLRHRLVELVGVHDCRNNVVLAVNLTGETVRFFVELLGVFVAAVLFKIPCVHINDEFVENRCARFLPSCGDLSFVDELLKILVVCQAIRILKMNIKDDSFGIYVEIRIAFVLAFVVPLVLLGALCGNLFHTNNAPIPFRHSNHLRSVETVRGTVTQLFQSA